MSKWNTREINGFSEKSTIPTECEHIAYGLTI